MYPPRPNAIATILKSKDDVKNIQTLLYSIIKKSPTTKSETVNNKYDEGRSIYAPELLLLTTKECNEIVKESDLDIFCDRIMVLESSIPLKIELFKLMEYDRILFIDSSFVVSKDISDIFETSLDDTSAIAAVPNSESGFSTNVLLIKPCMTIYESLYNHNNTANTNNISLTHKVDETLNLYFSGSSSSFTPLKETSTAIHQPSKSLQSQYLTKIETYKSSILKERATLQQKYEEKKRKASLNFQTAKASATAAAKNSASSKQSKELKEKHDSVSQRFKELRKEGMATKEAMVQARKDCGEDVDDGGEDKESGKQVAQMFGLNL